MAMLPAQMVVTQISAATESADCNSRCDSRPNILFVIADDLGKGDLSCYGNAWLQTPNIDRIGTEGLQLLKYRSAAPISGPSRVSVLTGRYHERSGYRMTHCEKPSSLDEPWIAGTLKENGYSTVAIGKWHLGDTDFNGRGFEDWVITAPGGWSDYYSYKVRKPDQPVMPSDSVYATDYLTDEAIDFIKGRDRSKPFFMYLAYNAPHFPLQAAEEDIAPFRGKGLAAGTEILYGMITCLDRNIGRLLSVLDSEGIAENTIVVFTSDNGPCLGSYKGLSEDRWNCGLSGSKENMLEGGINVPCLVRWPAKINHRDSLQFNMHAVDWAPTLLDAAGIEPDGKPFDGVSFLDAFTGTGTAPEVTRMWCFNKAYLSDLSNCAVIDGRWKLHKPLNRVLNAWNNKGSVPANIPSESWRLYDLSADPFETTDISEKYPEKYSELISEFDNWWKEVLSDNEEISGPAEDGVFHEPALKGFIVSDAHIGWENRQQPTVEKQREMINAIRTRFPSLDVFIDTGDPHHNGQDRDMERGLWTDNIMSQEMPVPFYYVPGNHDIAHANTADSEFVCAALGSHECRPYYSFDIKGIHFISIPELIRAVYVPREVLEWVKLDLELNRDKTVILLSHNNLTGYSKTFEEGYRGVVNTREIIDLLDEYPNCVAWMYGHNHNYEVVNKDGRLYVSNGRIGGFDPSKGKYGLGGIYFEITENRVEIRSYSAEYRKFLEKDSLAVDSDDVGGILEIPTSFDEDAPCRYSYGAGMSRDGEKIPVYHHHINAGTEEVFMANVAGKYFNEDPDFRYYMCRKNKDRQLMGSSISGDADVRYEWLDPGIRLFPSEKRQTVTLPRKSHGKFTYYRVSPDKDYLVSITLEGGKRQHAEFVAELYDRAGNFIARTEPVTFRMTGRRQTVEIPVSFSDPDAGDSTIYCDDSSDNVLNLSAYIAFPSIESEVIIHEVGFSFRNAGESTKSSSVTVQGDNPRDQNRSVVSVRAGGNGLVTWLVRLDDVRMQVLGAPCAVTDSSYVIGPLRNRFSQKKEVSLNPMPGFEEKTFVFKLRNIDSAEILPLEKGHDIIRIKVDKTIGTPYEIDIYSTERLFVEGADSVLKDGLIYTVEGSEDGVIEIRTKK